VSEKSALHCWITGTVQGVFFRDSTTRRARELGLAGWVRNLPDGRVEALFCGTKEACELALAYVRVGPPSSQVSDVEFSWEDTDADVGVTFEIRW
jgi:acylphosphatase